jgi:hypothetical protein
MKIAIVNDTSSAGHFGCELTMQVLNEQILKRGAEIVGSVPFHKDPRDYSELLAQADLVIVNGEGTLHHGHKHWLIRLGREYPSVLINAVYQANPNDAALKEFKYISVRESMSAAALKEHGIEAEIVPDLVFSSKYLQNIKDCSRGPKAIGIIDSVNPGTFFNITACQSADAFFMKLFKYQRICTGRFHGIVACAVLGIPFVAYRSNTHKNEGLMWDMQAYINYCDTLAGAMLSVPCNVKQAVNEYAEAAPARIEAMFDKILSL